MKPFKKKVHYYSHTFKHRSYMYVKKDFKCVQGSDPCILIRKSLFTPDRFLVGQVKSKIHGFGLRNCAILLSKDRIEHDRDHHSTVSWLSPVQYSSKWRTVRIGQHLELPPLQIRRSTVYLPFPAEKRVCIFSHKNQNEKFVRDYGLKSNLDWCKHSRYSTREL